MMAGHNAPILPAFRLRSEVRATSFQVSALHQRVGEEILNIRACRTLPALLQAACRSPTDRDWV
jgi:hypothetical protein